MLYWLSHRVTEGKENKKITQLPKKGKSTMPLIQVQMFSGRTPEQKRNLVRALTDAFVQTVGSTPDAVDVILTDVEKSDWAQGGELFSDKVLGA